MRGARSPTAVMSNHLDLDDPRYRAAAARILRRHDNFEAEANITSAVRDFLILTGLAESDEIVEENPPSEDSRRKAVDLTALNTFMEFKRRIGSTGGFEPNPQYVQQLDDYLAQSEAAGRGVRIGILTDGRHWLLRWPNAGEVRTTPPHAFLLDSADRWFPLYEWLRDKALASQQDVLPKREVIVEAFGPNSPLYERDIAALGSIYQSCAGEETVRIKRRLWRDLLLAALGEIARTPAEMNDLFVRHTYLSAVIGMAVQASFGVDIYQLARNDPADLLLGRRFQQDTGLSGNRGVGLLRLAAGSCWRAAVDQSRGRSRGPVRLAQCARRCRRRPVRERHPARRAAPAGRVLHPPLAGADDGARSGH